MYVLSPLSRTLSVTTEKILAGTGPPLFGSASTAAVLRWVQSLAMRDCDSATVAIHRSFGVSVRASAALISFNLAFVFIVSASVPLPLPL